MKKSLFAIPVVLIGLLVSCQNNKHFISDAGYRSEVEKQFKKRKSDLSARGDELFGIFDKADLKREHKEALQFLYAYMSLNDLGDYNSDFFYRQTKAAFEARDYFSWGKKVPEELFRHFVLPPRVNNEDLDTARIVFFNELKNRIEDMNMTDAALEVNHWCHEKVTYRPADSRTSSPLATVRTGYGRCGEESTFTVTALRAVGIPARQCYTPRWAHTDDNHAWVEVWADGKWYFMGACEPEAELNKAWFTYPAKRAMMVHTNVFGKYDGPESKTEYPLYTKINVLENYTITKKLDVIVVDENSNAVSGAKVKFLIYNYAEYYPVYEQVADQKGKASIITGLGDVMVWAAKNGKYGYRKVAVGVSDEVLVQLDKTTGNDYQEEWDIKPPVNLATFTTDTTAKTAENNKRLHFEDSLRNNYLSTFMKGDSARTLAKKLGLNAEKVVDFITKSEGNYSEISEFLIQNADNPNALNLLSTLTDKDLRDTPAAVLQSHLENSKNNGNLPDDVFIQGILSPRISNELIRDWRPFLQKEFKGIFSSQPTADDIKQWMNKHIQVVEDENYSGCLISPIGVYKLKKTDKNSRKVFFVALCRSLNIPTVVDSATGEIRQYLQGKWNTVTLDTKAEKPATGKLTINYYSQNGLIPQYWTYYTVSKFTDGFFQSLDFEGDKRVEKFPVQLDLEAGYYCITTGNRYADGRVLARNEYFTILPNKTITKNLIIRALQPEKKIYGALKSNSLSPDLYQQKGMVICFLEPDREPTKHILNELPNHKSELDKWGGNFVFVVPENKLSKNFEANNYKNLPQNSTFITRQGIEIMNDFLKSTNQSFRDNYPLIYIVNPQGKIIFYSEGYRIGVGDLIWKTVTTN